MHDRILMASSSCCSYSSWHGRQFLSAAADVARSVDVVHAADVASREAWRLGGLPSCSMGRARVVALNGGRRRGVRGKGIGMQAAEGQGMGREVVARVGNKWEGLMGERASEVQKTQGRPGEEDDWFEFERIDEELLQSVDGMKIGIDLETYRVNVMVVRDRSTCQRAMEVARRMVMAARKPSTAIYSKPDFDRVVRRIALRLLIIGSMPDYIKAVERLLPKIFWLHNSAATTLTFDDLLKNFNPDSHFEFTFSMDRGPHPCSWILQRKYLNMNLSVRRFAASADDVQREVERRRRGLGEIRVSQLPAVQYGDIAVVRVEVFLPEIGKGSSDASTMTRLPDMSHRELTVDTVIGENLFLPGFAAALIGVQRGASRTFLLPVPSSWHDESLRGCNLQFFVSCLQIFSCQPLELSDENAGRFEELARTVEEVMSAIWTQEEAKAKFKQDAALREAVRRTILEEADLDLGFFQHRATHWGLRQYVAYLYVHYVTGQITEDMFWSALTPESTDAILVTNYEIFAKNAALEMSLMQAAGMENFNLKAVDLMKDRVVDMMNEDIEFMNTSKDFQDMLSMLGGKSTRFSVSEEALQVRAKNLVVTEFILDFIIAKANITYV